MLIAKGTQFRDYISVALSYCTVFLWSLYRGPEYGQKGKVMLAFEDNGSSKVGIRFDKKVCEGNDLGGLCEEDHGFFCTRKSGTWFRFCKTTNNSCLRNLAKCQSIMNKVTCRSLQNSGSITLS